MTQRSQLLNQVAETLLEQAGDQLLPDTPPILQLAMLAVPEGQEDSDRAMLIANAERSPEFLQGVLAHLAENLDLEDLEDLDPKEAGRSVLTELEPNLNSDLR